jgi:hypothetical protein
LLTPAVRRNSFKFGDALLQFVDLGTRTRQHLRLDFEFFAGDQVEAAQSLRQNILEVGSQILLRLCQPWRYQRHKPQGNLIDILLIHHGQRLALVEVNTR